MPTTPGNSLLSCITNKLVEIKQNFSIVDTLERPTAAHVKYFRHFQIIVLLACLSWYFLNQPCFSRNDGLRTEKVDKLRAKDIAALKLPAARLAYLSSCSTANSTSKELASKVTHIAS